MRKNKLDISAKDEEEVAYNDEKDLSLNSGMPTSSSLPSAIESSIESDSNHSDRVDGSVAIGNSVNLDVIPIETEDNNHEMNEGLTFSLLFIFIPFGTCYLLIISFRAQIISSIHI